MYGITCKRCSQINANKGININETDHFAGGRGGGVERGRVFADD
jgi:hypothetical protein